MANLINNDVFKKEQINFASGDVAGARDLAVFSPTPSTDSSRASATPPPAHVWKSVSSQHRKSSRAVRVCHIFYRQPPTSSPSFTLQPYLHTHTLCFSPTPHTGVFYISAKHGGPVHYLS